MITVGNQRSFFKQWIRDLKSGKVANLDSLEQRVDSLELQSQVIILLNKTTNYKHRIHGSLLSIEWETKIKDLM